MPSYLLQIKWKGFPPYLQVICVYQLGSNVLMFLTVIISGAESLPSDILLPLIFTFVFEFCYLLAVSL